jgi:type IV secretion system protein TrbD
MLGCIADQAHDREVGASCRLPLTEPILLGGAPRAVAILNGTVAAALGLGLRLWIAGLLLWALGHAAAVWAAKRDPLFIEVARRHLRIPTHLNV